MGRPYWAQGPKKLLAGPVDGPKGCQSWMLLAPDRHRNLRVGVSKTQMVGASPVNELFACPLSGDRRRGADGAHRH